MVLVVGGVGWAGSVAFSRAFRQQQAQTRTTQVVSELKDAIDLYNAKRYQEAAQAFARIRQGGDKSNAENARQYESYCYVELANMAIKQGDLATAERWLSEAQRITPDAPNVQAGLESVRQARAMGTPSTPVAQNGATPSTAPTPSVAFNPNATREDFLRGNQDAARLAENLLSEGNDLFRKGNASQALLKWSQTTAAAPGSPAATQAQKQIQQYNLGQEPF